MIVETDHDLCVGRAPALVAGIVNDMIPMEKQMTDASRDVVLWGPKIRVALSPMTAETTWTFVLRVQRQHRLTMDTSEEEGSSCVNRRNHMVTSWSLSVRSVVRPRRKNNSTTIRPTGRYNAIPAPGISEDNLSDYVQGAPPKSIPRSMLIQARVFTSAAWTSTRGSVG